MLLKNLAEINAKKENFSKNFPDFFSRTFVNFLNFSGYIRIHLYKKCGNTKRKIILDYKLHIIYFRLLHTVNTVSTYCVFFDSSFSPPDLPDMAIYRETTIDMKLINRTPHVNTSGITKEY